MTLWWPALAGYGIGSLPLGYLIVRASRGIDLRQAGSGNVGATNVYRTSGWALGLVVLVIDVAKGAASVWLPDDPVVALAAGVGAIIGHMFPVWLGFRGGKGVATATGVFAVVAPAATGVATVLFVLTLGLTRYVSLGSIVAACALPIAVWATGGAREAMVAAAVTAALVVITHRGNIRRLKSHTERAVGA